MTFTSQYEFKYTDSDGKEVIYKCERNTDSWSALLREFHLFLRGQGFIFDNDAIFELTKGEYGY